MTRESIVRCNICREIIIGPTSTRLDRPDLFTLLNNETEINVSMGGTWHALQLKLSAPTHKDICSACLIGALNSAIAALVAKRLEGGENI